MLNRETLVRLSEFRDGDRTVVSLYIPVERHVPEDKHLIHLKNLQSEIESQAEGLPSEATEQVAADLERAGSWLRESYARGGQSAAIFACGDRLWETVSLPFDLPARAVLSDRPRLRPLYRLLQRYERYLAILSDARDARLFLVTPNGAEELGQVEDDTPGRHDQGGWSQSRFQRHQDKMVDEHLERAADMGFQLFQSRGVDGVVLMGTEDRTNRLNELLHDYLQQRVLDRVPMEMDASSRQIAEATLEVARTRRRARQQEALDLWENSLKGSDLAISGLEATLRAAQQGQLMRLILVEDLEAEGGECRQCGALTSAPGGTCDYCGGEIRTYRDVTDPLAAAAISQGAELIFVPSGEGADRLDRYGGVGAQLRYA